MTAAGFSAALGKCLDEGRDPLCEDVIWAMGALRRSSLQCLVRTAYRRHCAFLQDRAGWGGRRGEGRREGEGKGRWEMAAGERRSGEAR